MSGVISRVAVCGAGAMGSGIAQVAAQAGATVTVFDVQAAALTAGEARFGAALDMLANKGRISAADAAATRSRTTWTSSLDALADTDLVVEAIIEDAAIKAHLFAALEAVVRPDAIIGSNTSSLAITMLASGFKHPERFVGIHFFNPAPVMKLVEVVAGAATDAAVVDLVQRTAQAWGKVAVAVADVPGFIVNRVARPFYAEAFAAWGEGAADATTIDALMKAAGFRMGPLELTDLIGQDVNFAVARSIYQASFGQTRFVPQPRQAALVDAGWLGRKSGRGVFNYAKAAGSLAQPETGASPDLSPAEPSVVEAVRRQVTGGWSEPFIACQGVLIGPTRGLSARSEAVRERKPCVLLDWFDAQGRGPVAYAATSAEAGAVAQKVLHALSRPGHQVADRPGLIVMRTLAQISNAACDAVLEQVAGEADVDNALRHGANYPFGPFSWLDRVGRDAVIRVLSGIAHETGKPMYQPSEYLRRTA